MPYWKLFYHLTWGTKNRLDLIQPSWENDLNGYLWGKANAIECTPHAINGVQDYIHVVISIPPKLAVSTVVSRLKGASSYHITHSILNNEPFAWQAEYGAVTFSERHLPNVVAYVQNQKKHHAEDTLWKNLEYFPVPESHSVKPQS